MTHPDTPSDVQEQQGHTADLTLAEARASIIEQCNSAGADEPDDEWLDQVAKQRVIIDCLSLDTIAMMLADLRNAAIKSSPASPVQQHRGSGERRQAYWIKPLEWQEEDGWHYAHYDEYAIKQGAPDRWAWRGPDGNWTGANTAHSLDAAKAAAEEHYRARLLQCLEPVTGEDGR